MKRFTSTIIIMGDLNTALDKSLDTMKGTVSLHDDIVEEVQELMTTHGLLDAFRSLYPNQRAYSYAPMGSNAKGIYRRLDHCLATAEALDLVTEAKYIPMHMTDHKCMVITLEPNEVRKHKQGIWRHNDTYNKDPEFKSFITEKIREAKEDAEATSMDPGQRWEWLKMQIRSACQAFGKARARANRTQKKELQQSLETLDRDPLGNKEAIEQCKKELATISRKEEEAVMFRARVQYVSYR